MGKVLIWLVAMFLGGGICLQEVGCIRHRIAATVAPQVKRVESVLVRETRVLTDSLPKFNSVLDERRSEFNAVVFGQIPKTELTQSVSRVVDAVPVVRTNDVVAYDPATLLKNCYADHSQVEGVGEVVLILSRDPSDSHSQKFIARLDSGKMMLIVHNTGVAPRIENLELGDQIAFCGEYSVGQRGESITRTHRDTANRAKSGWLKHDGKVYQ
jgi:hypothetical protein